MCFVMSAWNTVLVQPLLATHSRNSHYFSEVESSVLYSNFEAHCLALNSFFAFKNTLWSYHALSLVYTGLSVVVLFLGLCAQCCVQDNRIISTEMLLFLEILLSMSWSKVFSCQLYDLGTVSYPPLNSDLYTQLW